MVRDLSLSANDLFRRFRNRLKRPCQRAL